MAFISKIEFYDVEVGSAEQVLTYTLNSWEKSSLSNHILYYDWSH